MRRAAWAATWAAVTLGALFASAAPFQERVQQLEPPLRVDTYLMGGGLWWKGTVPVVDGATFVRLRVDDIANPANEPFEIVFRNETGRVVDKRTSKEIGTDKYFDTVGFEARKVAVSLESDASLKSVRFAIREYSYATLDDTKSLSIPQPIPWTDAWTDASPAVSASRGAVGLVYFESAREACTGFLASPRHLITNRHCIDLSASYRRDKKRCDDVRFEFSAPGEPSTAVVARCGGVSLVSQVRDIDLAILEVRAADLPKLAGRTPLAIVNPASKVPRAARVLHHPGGIPYLKASVACEIREGKSNGLVDHTCATIGGSSGAPIIDADTGAVLAVHAFGYEDGLSKAEYDRLVAKGVELFNQAVEGSRAAVQIKSLPMP